MSAASPRTALELYAYCKVHGLGTGISEGWTLKHFGMIEDALTPDEQVLTAFVGFHNYKSMSSHDGNFAYVITNKRFILAQKKLIGGTIQTISLSNVNDVTLSKNLVNHFVVVDTIKETFNVNTQDAKTAENIYHAIHKALGDTKAPRPVSGGASSLSDQLAELKKLLDTGLITQRDFDAKKKQILGI